jgi:NAD(P)H-hydrate repair Nnr-like enzyme with NAD(P)H-hydrate dehydratase domain
LITGFLAQGMNALSAALSGVLILGETAKQVRLTQGYFLSQDLLPGLSKMVWDNAEKARDLR